MRRQRWGVCRRGDLPSKQDTPVKPAVKRLEKLRRFASCKRFEALPEEPEVEDAHAHAHPATFTSTDPIQTHVRFTLHVRSPLFDSNPRDAHVDVLPATTADAKPSYQVSPAAPPIIQSHRGGAAKEEEHLSVTRESIISSGVESDTLNLDDDNEDCNSSASSSGCSLPSPEIFRREIHAETETFPIEAEPLCVHPHVRNSTLLDVSHARSIHMHQPLDLSAIVDSSRVKVKNCEMSINKEPEADTELKKASFKSVKDMKYTTPANPTKTRPIMCKKNVIFKSPILTEILSPAKCCMHCTADPVQTSGRADQAKAGEKKKDALRLRVPLRRPAKRSPGEAKFFDFVSDSDEDVFFNMMRERSVRLKSAPVFPLTAAKYTVASVL